MAQSGLWFTITVAVIVVLLCICGAAWLFFQYYQDDEGVAAQHQQRKATEDRSKAAYVTDAYQKLGTALSSVAKAVDGLKETIIRLERRVTQLETTSPRGDELRNYLREELQDYVPMVRCESNIRILEGSLVEEEKRRCNSITQLEERIRSLQNLQKEVVALREALAGVQGHVDALQREEVAKRRALIQEARRELDALVSELAKAFSPDAVALLNALTTASRAEMLPQLMKVGQRLLAEIHNSEAGALLDDCAQGMSKLRDIQEKLNQLLTGGPPGAEQKLGRLMDEARKISASHADRPSYVQFPPEKLEQARRELVKEVGMPYVSIVMGRFQGDGNGASAQIARILRELGLELIEVTLGKTRPDNDHYIVQTTMLTDKYPPGTVASVVKMGYTDPGTGEISPAQVIVAA